MSTFFYSLMVFSLFASGSPVGTKQINDRAASPFVVEELSSVCSVNDSATVRVEYAQADSVSTDSINKYDRVVAVIVAATEKIDATESLSQLIDIDDQLVIDMRAIVDEYMEEFESDFEIMSDPNADEALKNELKALSNKVETALAVYERKKRIQRELLRD